MSVVLYVLHFPLAVFLTVSICILCFRLYLRLFVRICAQNRRMSKELTDLGRTWLLTSAYRVKRVILLLLGKLRDC